MHISLEEKNGNAIEAYSENAVRINATEYQHNLLISRADIITPWPIQSLSQLTAEHLTTFIKMKPEIILIGHNEKNPLPPSSILDILTKQQIALECMLIAPACRTFNVLLGEDRRVVLGIIF